MCDINISTRNFMYFDSVATNNSNILTSLLSWHTLDVNFQHYIQVSKDVVTCLKWNFHQPVVFKSYAVFKNCVSILDTMLSAVFKNCVSILNIMLSAVSLIRCHDVRMSSTCMDVYFNFSIFSLCIWLYTWNFNIFT